MGFKFKRLVKSYGKTLKGASKAAGKVLTVATPVAAGVLAATGVGIPLAAGIAAGGSLGGAILSGGSRADKLKSFKRRAIGAGAAVAGGALIGATGIFSGASSAAGAAKAAGVGGGATATGTGAGGVLPDGTVIEGPLAPGETAVQPSASSPGVLDSLLGAATQVITGGPSGNVPVIDEFPGFPKNSGAPGSTGSSDPRNALDQDASPQIDNAEGLDESGRPRKKDNTKTYLLIGGAALILLLLWKRKK